VTSKAKLIRIHTQRCWRLLGGLVWRVGLLPVGNMCRAVAFWDMFGVLCLELNVLLDTMADKVWQLFSSVGQKKVTIVTLKLQL